MNDSLSQEPFDPHRVKYAEGNDFPHDELAQRVIGAAIEVHRTMGAGHAESAYELALAIEFEIRNIQFQKQYPIQLHYKGRLVGEGRLDFLVENELILELKAIDTLKPVHMSQVISYLRMTGKQRALLINFNEPLLKHGIKRIVL